MTSSDDSAAKDHRNGDDSDNDSESESSDDELLFKFPHRGEFKRRVDKSDSDDSGQDSDEEGKGKGGASSDDSGSDDDEMGGTFSSSLETRRRVSDLSSGAAGSDAGRSAEVNMESLLCSDDEDDLPAPPPKRRKVLTQEEIQARAQASVDALLESDGCGSTPRNANKKDREYTKRMQKKLADATKIVDPGGSRTRYGSALHGAAAASASATETLAALKAETAARREQGLDKQRVRLTVRRSKRQQHVFNTSWGRRVDYVEDACRGELDLVSRDEEEEAEITLFYKEKKLDSSKTLRQAGIPAEGAVLRLDVTGGGGGGDGGGGASGPPITIKVRVEGGKTFTVSTTTETKFSAFMEGFNAKVGIPLERAHESVFRFDGDKLNPNDTPEGQDMESDELIEAKFPEDLMKGVQASENEMSLVAPKAKKVARKAGTGKGKGKGAARSRTAAAVAAAVAAAAKPLGGGASKSPQSGTKRRSRGGDGGGRGGGREASAMKQPDIVVLD